MARVAALALAVMTFASSARAQSASTELPAAPPTSSGVTLASDGSAILWPTTTPDVALRHPILRRGRDVGILTAGILLLTVGASIGVGMAANDALNGNCISFRPVGFGVSSTHVSCDTGYLAFVPVAGSMLVGSLNLHGPAPDTGWIVLGSLAVVPQIVGLILVMFAAHGYTEDLVSLDDTDEASVTFVPLVSGTELGGMLEVWL
jgi:hypothetical protein